MRTKLFLSGLVIAITKSRHENINLTISNHFIGISDCTAPFTVGIHTVAGSDPASATSLGANGVCLNYSQKPC